ncbi:c-type cytochrome [Maribacter thermophilus]|uniref:c-type cytochrome n=1 Tax=Maribacter thermophilus TaxID=1197874 RepID=UPI0006414253|nr:c-type cytochrome [Maribacter thermophilus]
MEEIRLLARRLLVLFISMLALIVVLFILLLTYKPSKNIHSPIIPEDTKVAEWRPKNVLAELNNMPSDVKMGYFLVAETSNYMGPSAKDSTMRFAGNNLACTNCHLQNGTQAGSASWVGVIDRFPQFGGRANKTGTIEERINGCMERSMNGKMLPEDSEEIKAIVAYMTWLGEDLPKDKEKEFKGYGALNIPNKVVDLKKGEEVFEKECTLCHGADGQGIRYTDASKGYQYPPLWGNDSYNDGAGMYRVIAAAQFIKSNMPFGQATWKNPKLTDEEAYNVAGYINSFSRPHKSNTEDDYPDKKLKPVSTPYGPWADDFSAAQHKYGPFQPIMEFYKKQYNIIKTK